MIDLGQLAYPCDPPLAGPRHARLAAGCDVLRESLPLRASRVLVQFIIRGCMRWYHRLTVIGQERFLDIRPAIIAANHSSHLDAIAIFSSLPFSQISATCSAAARDYFFAGRLTALVARLLANGIPIDRRGGYGSSLRPCIEKLLGGTSLILFPEGTRTRTGRMGLFKPGVVALSRRARVPVIPTCIRGTLESLGLGKYFPRPEPITVVFGEPMRFWKAPLAQLRPAEAARLLADRVRAMQVDLGEGSDDR
jgi:1-acyl-sn-glycerol-3-phosphate acyltransferase